MSGEAIEVFNQGVMRRDMTHVSDVVRCIEAVMLKPAIALPDARPHQVYNIGYGEPQNLSDMIDHLERLTGKRVGRLLKPAPPGDVLNTWADMRKFKASFGIVPEVALEQGLREFYTWYADWKVSA
jgi:UDP-glucuronate 4-epimerase